MTLIKHSGKIVLGLSDSTPLFVIDHVRKIEARKLGLHPSDLDVQYVMDTETFINMKNMEVTR
jgi:hypothetical protein